MECITFVIQYLCEENSYLGTIRFVIDGLLRFEFEYFVQQILQKMTKQSGQPLRSIRFF